MSWAKFLADAARFDMAFLLDQRHWYANQVHNPGPYRANHRATYQPMASRAMMTASHPFSMTCAAISLAGLPNR